MKIGFTGLDIQEGKIKYQDPILIELAVKDNPKKISPFFVEFLKDEYLNSDAIVVHKDNLLDILILDMDKIEGRINRATDKDEINLLEKYFGKEIYCAMQGYGSRKHFTISNFPFTPNHTNLSPSFPLLDKIKKNNKNGTGDPGFSAPDGRGFHTTCSGFVRAGWRSVWARHGQCTG